MLTLNIIPRLLFGRIVPSHVSACVLPRPARNHTLEARYHSDDSVGPVTDMKKGN